jgi:hypothetical protein
MRNAVALRGAPSNRTVKPLHRRIGSAPVCPRCFSTIYEMHDPLSFEISQR